MAEKKYKTSGEFFVAEKTNDVFMEVEFAYGDKTWTGLLPKHLQKQGLDLEEDAFSVLVEEWYDYLHPENREQWIRESDLRWNAKKSTNQTYKVLNALYSGEWECRVCGPVPKVNPQPAARLASLKKKGYIIGSKRRRCLTCNQSTMHDILIMLPSIESRFAHGNELRAPMSDNLKERIKKVLNNTEVCFNVKRQPVELLIDHKFPSQRWNVPENRNPDNMPEVEIRQKFQLLSNQTNMWKSRYCDHCVKTGIRGNFMGIKWFYKGNDNWDGKTPFDEEGCVGCPWYDLVEWKEQLNKKINPILPAMRVKML